MTKSYVSASGSTPPSWRRCSIARRRPSRGACAASACARRGDALRTTSSRTKNGHLSPGMMATLAREVGTDSPRRWLALSRRLGVSVAQLGTAASSERPGTAR